MARTVPYREVVVPSDVLVQRLVPDNDSVLLNLATGIYYGLDTTGTAMWAALVETGNVRAAAERLVREFDTDTARVRTDLDELVQRLVQRGLLRIGPHLP